MRRGSMPSIDQITQFWAGRCLKCDSTWRECSGGIDHSRCHVFCDSGEPNCARCDKFLGYTPHAIRHFHGKCAQCALEPDAPECDCGDPTRCSEYPRFYGDRAHLVPFSVCNENKPGNIIPLCHNCHRINPEPSDPVTGRRKYLDWLCQERDAIHYQLRIIASAAAAIQTQAIEDFRRDGSVHPLILVLANFPHPRNDAHEVAKEMLLGQIEMHR